VRYKATLSIIVNPRTLIMQYLDPHNKDRESEGRREREREEMGVYPVIDAVSRRTSTWWPPVLSPAGALKESRLPWPEL